MRRAALAATVGVAVLLVQGSSARATAGSGPQYSYTFTLQAVPMSGHSLALYIGDKKVIESCTSGTCTQTKSFSSLQSGAIKLEWTVPNEYTGQSGTLTDDRVLAGASDPEKRTKVVTCTSWVSPGATMFGGGFPPDYPDGCTLTENP